MQDKIRKLRHNIYISGFGVVILGFWNVVKSVLSITAGTAVFYDQEEYTDIENFLINLFIIIIVALISVIFFAIHLYIGINAMKVGKGERRKRRFIIACVVLMAISMINIPSYFHTMSQYESWDTIFAAVLVDLTLIMCLADILYSHKMIKNSENSKR